MKALYKFTWSALWKNKSRTLVTLLGIILSAALFTAVTTLGVSSRSYLMDATVYSSGDYFLRFDYSTEEQRTLAAETEAVSQMGTLSALGYSTLPNGETDIVAAGDDSFFTMFSLRLTEGRLPRNGNELVLPFSAWEALGKPSLGDSLSLSVTQCFTPPQDMTELNLPTGDKTFTKTFTLVGISEGIPHLDDWDLDCSHFFTKSEENQSALWHRLFLKTDPPEAAFELQNRHLGQVDSLNSELLALYGTS
ncbi:MAG: ABC transporter permease, partial [Oscillospiraceae bacterium]|nr:ABC transporter permease [Oscillospiraceae bacterium]